MDGNVSPAAQAANRRLYELRERLAAGKGEAERRATTDSCVPTVGGRPPAPVGDPPTTSSHSLAFTESSTKAPDQAAGRHIAPEPSHPSQPPECLAAAGNHPASVVLHDRAATQGRAGGAPSAVLPAGRQETSTMPSHSETPRTHLPPVAQAVQLAHQPAAPAVPPRQTTGQAAPPTFAEAAAILAALPPATDHYPLPTAHHPPPATQPSLAELARSLSALPSHLGWGSETLTAHLRKSGQRSVDSNQVTAADVHSLPLSIDPAQLPSSSVKSVQSVVSFSSAPSVDFPSSSHIKVYPAIALGLLREERTAAGRLWLLLRHLDAPGRGMVTLAGARAALCDNTSPLRLCGWRRLRQLLAEGEGVFWTRRHRAGDDRLWLHGPARVAAALGVRRLVGRPVGLPPAALLGPIGDARAHLYATFHSGRAKEMTSGELQVTNEERALNSSFVIRHSPLGMPIARDTLAELSGVCARSQAAYERRVGVASQANIALGERVAAAPGAPIGPAEQERAWQQGRALFRLRDHRGHHGRPGATYLAWRLPNAYGPARGHQPRPKGRQKRINRRLADLFTKGMTGNDERIEKRFYPTAAGAIRNYELRIRNEETNARSSFVTRRPSLAPRHWPAGGPGRAGHCCVWATAAGQRNRSKPADRPTIDVIAGNQFQPVSAGSDGLRSVGRR